MAWSWPSEAATERCSGSGVAGQVGGTDKDGVEGDSVVADVLAMAVGQGTGNLRKTSQRLLVCQELTCGALHIQELRQGQTAHVLEHQVQRLAGVDGLHTLYNVRMSQLVAQPDELPVNSFDLQGIHQASLPNLLHDHDLSVASVGLQNWILAAVELGNEHEGSNSAFILEDIAVELWEVAHDGLWAADPEQIVEPTLLRRDGSLERLCLDVVLLKGLGIPDCRVQRTALNREYSPQLGMLPGRVQQGDRRPG
mmetsp:Transcript_96606/g.277423  ORF Transcript_96606/g.277423 Transcript_96606/m.277423 type:complete len:253 (-) Transcript_96606:189-947(-)